LHPGIQFWFLDLYPVGKNPLKKVNWRKRLFGSAGCSLWKASVALNPSWRPVCVEAQKNLLQFYLKTKFEFFLQLEVFQFLVIRNLDRDSPKSLAPPGSGFSKIQYGFATPIVLFSHPLIPCILSMY
jgi:hypothetical protein